MTAKPSFTLGPGDSVLTAFAERCGGPGWANMPIWIVIRAQSPTGGGDRLRVEAIQPDEATPTLMTLARHSAAMHEAMTGAVEPYITRKRMTSK